MYVPIMKNRTVEVSVLQRLSEMDVFGENVIPLIELIQEKTRSNNNNTFIEDLSSILADSPKTKVMIDFYKSTKLRNTTDAIREYVTLSVRQPEFCLNELRKLSDYSDQVIPVISYLSESISLERITFEAVSLREQYPSLAFRIKVQEFDRVFTHIEKLITPSDFLILDIETASHMSPVFRKIYKTISDSKKRVNFKSIVVNAHRPEKLLNKDMIDGEPIAEIDNSLKDLHSSSYMYYFNGFGDYACIAANLPSKGGAISPVGIYYSLENNYFIAYQSRVASLSEFPDYIAPNIMNSEYWMEFDQEHHDRCPGCLEIQGIVKGSINGKNQAKWKMITMLHYIYTMYIDQTKPRS